MINAEIIEWKDAKKESPVAMCGESFLVGLAEDNPVEWTTSRPVMAEFEFSKGSGWTVFDSWEHKNISVNGYVEFWAELPELPAMEAFNVN